MRAISITGSYKMCDGVGPVFERQIFPQISMSKIHTQQRRKIDFYYDKASKSTTKEG